MIVEELEMYDCGGTGNALLSRNWETNIQTLSVGITNRLL